MTSLRNLVVPMQGSRRFDVVLGRPDSCSVRYPEASYITMQADAIVLTSPSPSRSASRSSTLRSAIAHP